MQKHSFDNLYLPSNAAEKLHIPVGTLAWWRHLGRGPRYVKIGRRIFYRDADLDEFIASSVIEPVSTKQAKIRRIRDGGAAA
jgi:hypothetical protein